MPEFLKKIFGDGPKTFEEFEAAYKAQETTQGGVKIVNLAEGGYVSKDKFDTKAAEVKSATDSLAALQEVVKKFEGVDVDKLKTAAADAQKKAEADLAAVRRDSAVDLLLVQSGARNVKAARALLDLTKAKVKEDGTLEGVDVEGLKKSDPYLFTIEQKKDEGGGHPGGASGAGGDKPGTLESEITSALYGESPAGK